MTVASKYRELAHFQLGVATRWLQRGNRTADPFYRFFCYFTAFNALYFLWGKIDDVRNPHSQPAGELPQIRNLLQKLTPPQAERLLSDLDPAVRYFSERRPIQRMDKRTAEQPYLGDDTEGKSYQRKLRQKGTPTDRVLGLGGILYLVRSNLVHGSKAESGDDAEIIEKSLSPLKHLLQFAISVTHEALNDAR